MSLGKAIISELGSRGQLGQFFDFQGYRELKQVQTCKELRKFLDSQQLMEILAPEDTVAVVNELQEKASTVSATGSWLLIDPFISAALQIVCGI